MLAGLPAVYAFTQQLELTNGEDDVLSRLVPARHLLLLVALTPAPSALALPQSYFFQLTFFLVSYNVHTVFALW